MHLRAEYVCCCTRAAEQKRIKGVHVKELKTLKATQAAAAQALVLAVAAAIGY